MSTPTSSSFTVLFLQEGESWHSYLHRLQQVEGMAVLVLCGREGDLIDRTVVLDEVVAACAARVESIVVVTGHRVIVAALQAADVTVLHTVKTVRATLKDHAALQDVLRCFAPHMWKQQLTSRLQRLGLLSMPRLRIFSLVLLSIILFYIVLFKLLPSAELTIHPRQEPVTQTVNIFLVSGTGAKQGIPERVRSLPLIPVIADQTLVFTFDQISKEFTGISSTGRLTVINTSLEPYTFRAGTRFTNQAGMVFRSTASFDVAAGQEAMVSVVADPTDAFAQIIGERGNLPAGVKWEIPGLSEAEQSMILAENREPMTGGTTSFVTVLKSDDIDVARKRLQQELLVSARVQINEKVSHIQAQSVDSAIQLLAYDELTSIAYTEIRVPEELLGMQVSSVTLSGAIQLRMFAYDSAQIFLVLMQELRKHVRDGRHLVEEDIEYAQLVAHVIDYADDQSWIKLTVDLSATEEYALDPLQPMGALFAKNVRELIAGKSREEALRIVRNLPEVETVSLSQWPPWQRILPRIGAHISIVTQ